MSRQSKTFLALCAGCALLLGVYLYQVKQRGVTNAQAGLPPPEAAAPGEPAQSRPSDSAPPAAAAAPAAPTAPPPEKSATPAVKPRPAQSRVFFRYTGVDSHYGKVAWTDSAHARQAHFVESLNCEVVYVAGGRGICLTADRGVFTTYSASLFDARNFDVTNTFPLKGIPSRARVSIDGSLAAFTVFVSGHGYTTLDFSTQSLLVDTRTGAALADLEDFEVRRDGAVIKEADFNFWGVTFTPDAKQFFATLSTAGKHFLVRGDIDARRMEVIHENVECPSLSPDARHVAYKKRLMEGNRIVWQLQVLELASGREVALSERRSIDDQLEWLDDRHVLYSVPSADDDSSPSTNVWIAPIDASGAPRLFLKNAYSPAAVRCKDPGACAAPG
jgi:hypothetical protein